MQKKLKILLVLLTVLFGQTLALAVATEHGLDPSHTDDDCAICLAVHANDTAPPPAAPSFEAPPAVYWAVGETPTKTALLKALSGTRKARAPPF